ncbi:hypothetical protein ACRHK7_00315 [Weissella tructae]|uniref:hypothetical protein n=1 Tax=Weissella tructae TaxID=887702 RepID=UPI003D8DE998
MAKYEKAPAYRALVDFHDFKEDVAYKAGDSFPVDTSVTRLKELLADDNEGRSEILVGAPLIEAIFEKDGDNQEEVNVQEEESETPDN